MLDTKHFKSPKELSKNKYVQMSIPKLKIVLNFDIKKINHYLSHLMHVYTTELSSPGVHPVIESTPKYDNFVIKICVEFDKYRFGMKAQKFRIFQTNMQ